MQEQSKLATRVVLAGAQADKTSLPGWDAQKLTLVHPRTGNAQTLFWLHGRLQEVNWFKQRLGSWFVNESVLEDGSLWICTPVDPLLVLLPIIESNCQQDIGREQCQEVGVFRDLDELLASDQAPDMDRLLAVWDPAPYLRCICDTKTADGRTYYRLSQEKVTAWLKIKIGRLSTALRTSGGAFQGMDEVAVWAYSAGLVSEYLPSRWSQHLSSRLGIPSHPEVDQHMQPLIPGSVASQQPAIKKMRLDPKEIARKRAAAAKAEAKIIAEAKEAATMKKLSNFFKPIAKPATA